MDLNRQVENGMFFYLATNDVNYFDPNDFYIVQMVMADNKIRLDFYHMPAKKKIYEQVVAEDDDDGASAEVAVDDRRLVADEVQNRSDHDHEDEAAPHAFRQNADIRGNEDDRGDEEEDGNRQIE